jgi:hypothetical protein
MGFDRMKPTDWKVYSSTVASKTTEEIFHQHAMHALLDPRNIAVRESRDSENNPNATPIIVGVDVTGSLGRLAKILVQTGLNTFVHQIHEHKPVSDPHLMLMALGDSYSDKSPLQVTQFETDIRLADQLGNFYLEGNGGSNGGEMYSLAWYFASTRTSCDSMIKRAKKGYLFTIGDEPVHRTLPAAHIRTFLNGEVGADIQVEDLLTMVNREWEVFHLVVTETRHGKMPHTLDSWRELLGERALPLDDHTKMAEVIISTIRLLEGTSHKEVMAPWSGNTGIVVAKAIDGLSRGLEKTTGPRNGLVYI